MSTLPLFHASNELERIAMREHVLSRLFEDDDRNWQPVPQTVYQDAVLAARCGNLPPLAEFLSALHGSEIVAFLAVPSSDDWYARHQAILEVIRVFAAHQIEIEKRSFEYASARMRGV